ncbi:hypothetical protein ACWC9S_05100 [Streptomyces xiamenensis]
MRPGEQQPGDGRPSAVNGPYQQQGGHPTHPPYPYGGYQPPHGPTGPFAPTVLTPPPGGGGGGGGRSKAVVAVVATAVVAAAAVVTTVLVLRGGDGQPSAAPTPPEGESTTGARPAPDDPRRSVVTVPDPVVAPDWRVQTNADKHNAFDVPPEWQTNSEDTLVGYNDSREGADPQDVLVAMSGPVEYMYGWCAEADNASSRALAGTKAGQGASGVEEAATNEAKNWVLAAYDQEQQGTFTTSEPEPFTSEHGITGYTVTATVTDVPPDPDAACEGPEGGKAITFSYIDAEGDLATWVLVMDTGYPEEPSQETIDAMMNSLRPYAVD